MALHRLKKNKLWIWKAYDHLGHKLIDWQCGNRDCATLEILLDRLKAYKVVFYLTDKFEAYKSLIPNNRLFQGKDGTHAIERNNGRQRHWFGRFRRKSIMVSKSAYMVNITMAIFAAVHINKTLILPSTLC